MPDKPGLQTERTLMSWERSAFGFLVGGALVLMRESGPLEIGRTALALLAGVLALLVLGLGYRRSRRAQLTRSVQGHDVVPEPRAEALLLGYGTVVFAVAIVIVLVVSA